MSAHHVAHERTTVASDIGRSLDAAAVALAAADVPQTGRLLQQICMRVD